MQLNQVLRIVAILVALVGLLLVLQSTLLGLNAANSFLRSQGGSMDAANFRSVMDGAIASYPLLGAVLLGVGLFHALQQAA